VRVLLQVLKVYETQGFVTLLRTFNETGFLEVPGLDKLHADGEQVLEAEEGACT
jgi:hypothetical protein